MVDFVERHGQVLFWMIAGVVLVLFFGNSGRSYIQTFYFVSSLLPVAIATSYYFNIVLLPNYLVRRKYGYFVFYTFCTIVFSLFAQAQIMLLALWVYVFYQIEGANPVTINISSLNLMIFLMVILNGFARIVRLYGLNETKVNPIPNDDSVSEKYNDDIINVRYNRMNHPIRLGAIYYIESMADYVKIVLEHKEVVTKQKISKLQEELPSQFLRTHRSFIVNKDRIDAYNKEYMRIQEHQIPISRTYKKQVLEILQKGE